MTRPDPLRLAVRVFYGVSCLPPAGFVALRVYAGTLEGWGVWALAGAVRWLVLFSAGVGAVGLALIAWLRRKGRPVTGVVLATLLGGSLAVAYVVTTL
ncbi:MAG TPA: hypothetical protein VLL48_12385 [Longimicrobiales bacterium]|nr:hypothetical protein [Longimicrobiales bacterium]